MPPVWPFLVGITVLGCKDKEAPRPTEQHSPARTGSGVPRQPGGPATTAPEIPRLDPEVAGAAFDGEQEDKDWAIHTEAAIKAAAPELTDVDCKARQCRATMTAMTQEELMQRAERLSDEQSLRGTQAHSVLLTAPTNVNGKLSMQIYVRYDR